MTSRAADPLTAQAGHRFLVVGASGFIGRHLLRHLRARGFQALGTRSRSGKRPAQPDLIPFDLDLDRIHDVIPPEFFQAPGRTHAILCAAVDNMDWCFRERETSRRIYVDRLCRLIDDLTRLSARSVFISTCFAFDGAVGHYNEDAPLSPVNEYARQKLAVENHLAHAAPDGWTIRLDKVVGDDPAEETLFTQWHRLIRSRQPIVCIARSVLSPTYVGDVAEALLAGSLLGLHGVHHVANPEEFLRADLARLFCKTLQVDHPIEERPLESFRFTDARALRSSLDGTRFSRLSGLRPTPMREVMERFRTQLPTD